MSSLINSRTGGGRPPSRFEMALPLSSRPPLLQRVHERTHTHTHTHADKRPPHGHLAGKGGHFKKGKQKNNLDVTHGLAGAGHRVQ